MHGSDDHFPASFAQFGICSARRDTVGERLLFVKSDVEIRSRLRSDRMVMRSQMRTTAANSGCYPLRAVSAGVATGESSISWIFTAANPQIRGADTEGSSTVLSQRTSCPIPSRQSSVRAGNRGLRNPARRVGIAEQEWDGSETAGLHMAVDGVEGFSSAKLVVARHQGGAHLDN
jgi:hypothetical protein